MGRRLQRRKARAIDPSLDLDQAGVNSLHLRYPVEQLEEPLAEGIVTAHPTMPEFKFDPGQVGDIIAYLKSLEQ